MKSASAAWRRRIVAGILLLLVALWLLDRLFPPPLPSGNDGFIVLARDGSPLRAWPGSDGAWRYPVTPAEVSPRYIDALLGYEDRWFRWHPLASSSSGGSAGEPQDRIVRQSLQQTCQIGLPALTQNLNI